MDTVVNDRRMVALRVLEKQQNDAGLKQERSKANVAAKTREYQDAKAALEKAFRADVELKKVAQRNIDRIAERRKKLEAGATDEELLQPLDLEYIEVPGTPPPVPPPDPAPDPVRRASTKKGTAKKVTPSSKRASAADDDPQFRLHRKQLPGMFASDSAISGRTRRFRSGTNDMDTSPNAGGEEEGNEIVDEEEEEEDKSTVEDLDRARREPSAESALSHITLAQKPSKAPNPVNQGGMDFGLPQLPIGEPFSQQFEQTNSQLGTFEDAMDWAAQPFFSGDAQTPPDNQDGQNNQMAGGGNYEEWPTEAYQSRATSHMASSATSSSGLFVSQRPRRRRRRESTPLGFRRPSPLDEEARMVPDDGRPVSPLLENEGYTSLPVASRVVRQSTPGTMRPPGIPSYREDSLFGERISEPPFSMDIDQRPSQLPTPEPTRSHPYSREPSNDQRVSPIQSDGDGLFVSQDMPEPNSEGSMGQTQSTERPDKAEAKPAKKKGGKKKPTFLESLLNRRR